MTNPLSSYVDQINRERAERDLLFKDPQRSPLPSDSIANFKGLDYYPVDERYRIPATLNRVSRPEVMRLSTSRGNTMDVEKYGAIRFNFGGADYELIVFKANGLDDFSDSAGQLFVPFKDATNGAETHPDGRYVLISTTAGSSDTEFDLNRAFNPLSAYNAHYESVIAPDANRANLRATSGQRKYEDLG